MSSTRAVSRVDRSWLPAASGSVSVVLGLGAAELTAAFIAPTASPVLVVGAAIIDLVPGWVKDVVVSLFGTGDKAFLLVCIGVVVAVLAGVAGILEKRKAPIGRVIFAAGGIIGTFAAFSRAGASFGNVIPSIVAALVAILILPVFLNRLPALPTQKQQKAADRRRTLTESAPTPALRSSSLDRRRFLAWAGGTTAAGVLGVIGGQLLAAGAKAATAARAAFHLPKAAVLAPAIPGAASFQGISGLTPIVTANSDFYRIDTALQVPQIDPSSWKLKIHGMVEKEIELSWAELIALPLEESITTLMCVSNEVGGNLISNAVWLGYPLRHLLTRAKPLDGADMVFSTSQDGWTATTPLQALTDDTRNAILAIGMNGQPLPAEHGFPVRMVVPGLYGYVSATKWVVDLEVTSFGKRVAYWTERGWSERGPIKTSSRIDVPNGSATVNAGNVVVAGVAWDQHTGIQAVQVQVDNGPWNEATLAEAISIDTWRQWRWTWPATKGQHTLKVRATNADGEVQTAKVADVVPNGATGLHTVEVTVS